jgi:hypothetical protein
VAKPLRARLTLPAVAGPVDRGVRRRAHFYDVVANAKSPATTADTIGTQTCQR